MASDKPEQDRMTSWINPGDETSTGRLSISLVAIADSRSESDDFINIALYLRDYTNITSR